MNQLVGSPGRRTMWSAEYWARKGDVKLYVYRKRVTAPDDGLPKLPVLLYLDMCANLPVVDPAKIDCPVCLIRGEYDGIATEEDLLDFFAKLPSKDKQFVFISGLAHAATLGINRHKFWHAMQAFMTMPESRTLAEEKTRTR